MAGKKIGPYLILFCRSGGGSQGRAPVLPRLLPHIYTCEDFLPLPTHIHIHRRTRSCTQPAEIPVFRNAFQRTDEISESDRSPVNWKRDLARPSKNHYPCCQICRKGGPASLEYFLSLHFLHSDQSLCTGDISDRCHLHSSLDTVNAH